MKDRGNSRAHFYKLEKDSLRELPQGPYDLFYFKKAKVHPDCHFQHQKNFYSVPYKYVGKELDIKYNNKTVHAFFDTSRIASHSALKGHAHYSTIDEHYPEEKVVQINYHLTKSKIIAKQIGPHMEALVGRLIRMDKFPLKTLRKVQGVLGLSKNYSNDALESGAELCLEFNKLTYMALKNFTKNYQPKNEKVNSVPVRNINLICLQGGKDE